MASADNQVISQTLLSRKTRTTTACHLDRESCTRHRTDSPRRRRNLTNSSSPRPRWHASLSPERRVTKGNGENTSRANASVNQYYEESSRNRYFSNAKPDTSRSLDDDIISFLNTSPRPESFQSRLHQSVDNGWGTSEIYKNNEVALDETPDHDGDSFLEEIRQEDKGL